VAIIDALPRSAALLGIELSVSERFAPLRTSAADLGERLFQRRGRGVGMFDGGSALLLETGTPRHRLGDQPMHRGPDALALHDTVLHEPPRPDSATAR
jgi:hypothetical protein